MGFFRSLFKPSTPWIDEVRELVIDRTVNDPANEQGYGSNREEVARVINSLSEQDILSGTPEALIFRVVELYSSQGDVDMPDEVKLKMGVERPLLLGAARRRQQAIGRPLSDSESESLIEKELANLPKPLTLESYIDYRVLSIEDPGISKPFIDKARLKAMQFFGIK